MCVAHCWLFVDLSSKYSDVNKQPGINTKHRRVKMQPGVLEKEAAVV